MLGVMALHEFVGDPSAEEAQGNPASGVNASAGKVQPPDAAVPVSLAEEGACGLVAGRTVEGAEVAACAIGNVTRGEDVLLSLIHI